MLDKSGFVLENFKPKDARGIDKTTGKVDINDETSSSSSEEEEEDLRAKTPTPQGRRKKKTKKKGQAGQKSRSRSSSSSSSSSDTAKEDSEDEKKEERKKENDGQQNNNGQEEKALPIQTTMSLVVKTNAADTETREEEEKTKEEKDAPAERRVSVSSSSSSLSSRKDEGSSDDYSDSNKGGNRKNNEIKEVVMEDDEVNKEPLHLDYERPGTVMEVGRGSSKGLYDEDEKEEREEERQTLLSTLDEQNEDDENEKKEEEEKETKTNIMPITIGVANDSKKEKENDAASVASSSSSASPSSSSGSALIQDKGPNPVSDPTANLDTTWREENPLPEKKAQPEKSVEEQEEEKPKPKVQIIREDLNKKPESDSSSLSSSSSESDSDNEAKPKESKTQAEIHQNESQPESDPETTHGGNDPDNVANGSEGSNSRQFEAVIPSKAPPGSVLPLLEASQTTLEIKGVTLNKSQVYEVAEFLEKKSSINSINLVNCGIDDDDVQKLMEALRQSPSNPVMLNLGMNPLTVESVPHILAASKTKPNLEAVLLQGTRLGDDGVNALCDGIKDNYMHGEVTDKFIHELDLSDCKFGDQGAMGVARLLTSAVDIDTLTLTHNHAISSDGWKVIGDGLKLNANLETLTLDHNFIGDEGIEYITQGLFDNKSVTAIDLNDVGLTDRGGKSIMELLKRNTYILEITVMENKLSEDLSVNIQKYIALNKASFK